MRLISWTHPLASDTVLLDTILVTLVSLLATIHHSTGFLTQENAAGSFF
jgi:hypothetical protein